MTCGDAVVVRFVEARVAVGAPVLLGSGPRGGPFFLLPFTPLRLPGLPDGICRFPGLELLLLDRGSVVLVWVLLLLIGCFSLARDGDGGSESDPVVAESSPTPSTDWFIS